MPRRTTPRESSPASPMRRDASCRLSAPSTVRRCWPRSPRCSASTTTNWTGWRCRRPQAPTGSRLVPYLEGERSPNLPNAAGALHGMTARNLTAANIARAGVEGLLCSLAYCLDKISAQGVDAERIILVGGGARSEAVRGHRARDIRQARAGADPGGVCGAGRGPTGGLDTVAIGFAAGVVVRNHHDVHRRTRRRRWSTSIGWHSR